MQHWKVWMTSTILSLLCAANAMADDRLVLQLRWDHQFQFAGYYAAQWQGYYADEGLEVEIRSALNDKGKILSAVEEVTSGRADFGVGAADVLKANDQGLPLSLVATIFQQSAAAFYLKEETPFRSPADLTELRVARRVNDLIDVELQAMLLQEGIDLENVTAHQHQPGVEHLLSDEVQVIPGYRTTIPYLMSTRKRAFREIIPADYGVDFYGDSLFTRVEITQKHPELVEEFRRATLKGWQYALEHPEEMAVRISNELPRLAKLDAPEDFNRFQAHVVKELSLYPIVALGNSNPERWRRMHAFLKQLGQVDGELNLSTFIFDPERLRAEKQQRVESIVFRLTIAAVLLSGLFGLWTISLKRQVAERTRDLQQELAERHKTEAALRDNERLLRTIAENYPSYLSIIEADLTVGFTSGREFTKLGLNPDDFKGLPLEQVFREQTEFVRSYYQQAFAGQEVTFELFIDNQHQRYTAVPLYDEEENVPRILVVVANITERKKVEQALLESQERFDLAMQATHDGLFDWNLMSNEIYYSPTWKRMLGYADDELENDFSVWERLTAPEDVKQSWEMLQELLDHKRERFEMEFKMRHKDGHWVDILSRANAVFDEHGKGVRVVGTHVDISERKQVQKELYNLNRTLEAAQKMAKVGYWTYDIATQMPTWSEQMFVVCGCDQAKGAPHYAEHKNIWHPDDWEMADAAVQACIKGRPYNIVGRLIFPDGSIHYVNTQGFPRYNERNEITELFGTSQDITELKQAEQRLQEYSERLETMVEERTQALKAAQEKLLRQEKLAALGQLAGSVAHELRHPLGVLSNAAYFLNMSLPDADNTTKEYLAMIASEVRKSDKIISDLLDFSRNQLTEKHVRTATQLQELIDGVLMEHPPPEGVELESDFENALPPIQIDPQQIKQVVTNLLLNAYQAMPEGGTLTVGTRRSAIGSPGPAIKTVDVKNSVRAEPVEAQRGPSTGSGRAACDPSTQFSPVRAEPVEAPDQPVRAELVEAPDQPVRAELVEAQRGPSTGSGRAACDPSTQFSPVRAEPVEAPDKPFDRLRANGAVLLTVKDTGCGIAPEHLGKLFEPLFTTKSKGIGLGLAISKNLVEANGGRIEVSSEKGRGSVFTLFLPTKETSV